MYYLVYNGFIISEGHNTISSLKDLVSRKLDAGMVHINADLKTNAINPPRGVDGLLVPKEDLFVTNTDSLRCLF